MWRRILAVQAAAAAEEKGRLGAGGAEELNKARACDCGDGSMAVTWSWRPNGSTVVRTHGFGHGGCKDQLGSSFQGLGADLVKSSGGYGEG
ncbi:hypothetical protein M0R45_035773 [Rubus argutus]|uniref:Uncharacterized protein n=1 Tax=Rubus argutus TaxID=59490 RepID=A0AAW1VU46_RUBAR